MADVGRKPLIPYNFFEKHRNMPYEWAKSVLEKKYYVDISRETYYLCMAKYNVINAGRGRKPLVPDVYFVMHHDISDPEEMARVLASEHHKGCDAAYAQKRILELRLTAKRARRPLLVEDSYFLKNKGITDPEKMAETIKEKYGIDCKPYYAKKRMGVLGIKIVRGQAAVMQKRAELVLEVLLKEPSLSNANLAAAIEKDYDVRLEPCQVSYIIKKLGKEGKIDLSEIRESQRSRGLQIPNKFFEENPNLDFEAAAPILKERYGIDELESGYYGRARRKLMGTIPGMKPLVGRRKSKIPDAFFVKYPNLRFNDAEKVLKDEYSVPNVTKFCYYGQRDKLRSKIPAITNLHPTTVKPKIPEEFFRENPNLDFDDAAPLIKEKYGIKIEKSAYRLRRRMLKGKIPGMIDIRGCSKPRIPREFFEKHPNLRFEEAAGILENEYGIKGITKGSYKERRKYLKPDIPAMKNLNTIMIPTEFFIKHPNALYDEALNLLNEELGIAKISRMSYYNKRNALKGTVPGIGALDHRTERKSLIPDEFFLKHPNLLFEEAEKVLEQEYNLCGITRGCYYQRRRVLRSKIPTITELHPAKKKPLIPDEFFRENPNLDFDDAAPLIKEKYGIGKLDRGLYYRVRRKLMGTIPGMKRIGEYKPKIPEKFFIEHPNLTFEEAEKILNDEYGITIEKQIYKNTRSYMKRNIPAIKNLHTVQKENRIAGLMLEDEVNNRIPRDFFKKTKILSVKEVQALAKKRFDADLSIDEILAKRRFKRCDSREDIPKDFFKRTRELEIDDIQKLAKINYNVEISEEYILQRIDELEKEKEKRRSRNAPATGSSRGRSSQSSVMNRVVDYNWLPNPKDMAIAIMKTVGKKEGMSEEVAREKSEFILNFFGYYYIMVDNTLTPAQRDVFYMFEDAGLLTADREYITLSKGKEWRINYWILNVKNIQKAVMEQEEGEKKEAEKPLEEKVYEDLPVEIWER
ncbi:MAG: hypothetical protein PHC66_01715 [Candidatus Nanoarchaeia archaeon]|nr:hypothetical protein [Candidatus Nanoarchaeia archaeon]MDD5238929.1 hypothetical protein [Candidatus Nanoarchaeia archaeon]